MKIEINLDLAPKRNGKAFDKWCDGYGFIPINDSPMRADCGRFGTYFRNAVGVAKTKGGAEFLIYPEDLK